MTELHELQNSIQNCLHYCEKIHDYEKLLENQKLTLTLKSYKLQSLEIEQALQKLISQLGSEQKVKKTRPFGLCVGEFTVPDDFDAPLPDDILNLFE